MLFVPARRSVNLPVGEVVGAGAPVLGDVKSRSGLKVIAEVAEADVIGSSGRVSAGGNEDAVHEQKVSALQVPAETNRLNVEVGDTAAAGCRLEIGEIGIGDIGVQGAAGACRKQNHAADGCPEELLTGYEVEDIFDRPDVVGTGDRDGLARWAIEGGSVVIDRDVDVADPWCRHDAGVHAHLSGHPLRLLLRRHRMDAYAERESNDTGSKG